MKRGSAHDQWLWLVRGRPVAWVMGRTPVGQSRCCTASLGQSSPVGLTVAGLPRVLRFGDATGGQAAMRALPDIACGRRGRFV